MSWSSILNQIYIFVLCSFFLFFVLIFLTYLRYWALVSPSTIGPVVWTGQLYLHLKDCDGECKGRKTISNCYKVFKSSKA
jgi:hypothetical protein